LYHVWGLHTAGVTSSKLVPPTKIMINIGSTPLTGARLYGESFSAHAYTFRNWHGK